MATDTPNIKLKIIENDDLANQDLINVNTRLLDTELTSIKGTLTDVNTIKQDLAATKTDISTLNGRVTSNTQNISAITGTVTALETSKEDKADKGQPDGYASLDATGRVPILQLPAGVKEMRVVANIAARNGLAGDALYDGLRVRVLDATGDPTVGAGWAEYVYDAAHSAWVKTAEKESMDVVLDFSNIQNVPPVLKALSAIGGRLAYNGAIVNLDTRAVTFTGSGVEIPYPWEGTAKQIKIACKKARSDAFVFQVERQAKADYAVKSSNWEKAGALTLTLAAGSVYLEQNITHAIHAGDILRYTTTALNDTEITVQLIVENTITI